MLLHVVAAAFFFHFFKALAAPRYRDGLEIPVRSNVALDENARLDVAPGIDSAKDFYGVDELSESVAYLQIPEQVAEGCETSTSELTSFLPIPIIDEDGSRVNIPNQARAQWKRCVKNVIEYLKPITLEVAREFASNAINDYTGDEHAQQGFLNAGDVALDTVILASVQATEISMQISQRVLDNTKSFCRRLKALRSRSAESTEAVVVYTDGCSSASSGSHSSQ